MRHKKIQIMGILNITPDSFSDGGDFYNNNDKALGRAQQMIDEGADIIDIGGESTRPGSEAIDEREEIRRVVPVIKALHAKIPHVTLSIDTWKHEVAKQALTAGCTIVNSMNGFTLDKKLAPIVAKYSARIILYHIKGKPKTMQQGTITYANVILEIKDFFDKQIREGLTHGIQREQFILDPGIGFGKTVEQNLEIIKRLHEFTTFNLPIMIGVSRKSHLGLMLKDSLGIETTTKERLEASLAETAIAIQNGATIIRTHDIRETNKFLTVFNKLLI